MLRSLQHGPRWVPLHAIHVQKRSWAYLHEFIYSEFSWPVQPQRHCRNDSFWLWNWIIKILHLSPSFCWITRSGESQLPPGRRSSGSRKKSKGQGGLGNSEQGPAPPPALGGRGDEWTTAEGDSLTPAQASRRPESWPVSPALLSSNDSRISTYTTLERNCEIINFYLFKLVLHINHEFKDTNTKTADVLSKIIKEGNKMQS